MHFTTRFLRDEELDSPLDLQLRALLLRCFPHEAPHLETKRYFHECPKNRWFAFNEDGLIAAHVAAHEKVIGVGDEELKILGIAEVCVAPQFRGQGLVKSLLQEAHQWGRERAFDFALLAGDRKIYSSSGYRNSTNPIAALDLQTGQISVELRPYIMSLALGEREWPKGEIDLRGPLF